MSRSLKTIIGIVLLVVGVWVVWSGQRDDETLTLILGVAAIIGGLCFIAIHRRPRCLS